MLFDSAPFEIQYSEEAPDILDRSIASVLRLLERKLGVIISFNARAMPFERPDLLDATLIAEKLKEHKIITSFYRSSSFEDEPHLSLWAATCGDVRHNLVGGGTWKDDKGALLAMCGEGLERYIWWEERDYFVSPLRATAEQMKKRGTYIAPERFCGFSKAQRDRNKRFQFDENSNFLWTRGTSLVSKKPTYLPVQTISCIRDEEVHKEPLIRQRMTIGLATWPTKAGARLAGALELIEREAYMIWWLNQLVLPRMSLKKIREQSPALSDLFDTCERYGFAVHALYLPTDAPAHAVCVVLEDKSGIAPRFAFGLKAHRSLSQALLKATSESLRARLGYRRQMAGGRVWDVTTPLEKIGHIDRLFYWGVPEHAEQLAALLKGEEKEVEPAVWEEDSTEKHLQRILDWCRSSGFECVSVSLGASKKNVTPWYVEMVVIPELQPTHLNEEFQHAGGTRWQEIPRRLGMKPRKEMYLDAPHPFA